MAITGISKYLFFAHPAFSKSKIKNLRNNKNLFSYIPLFRNRKSAIFEIENQETPSARTFPPPLPPFYNVGRNIPGTNNFE